MPETNSKKRKKDRDKAPRKIQDKLQKVTEEKEKEKLERQNYILVPGDNGEVEEPK